jgi:hypothetical protein
MKKKGLVKAVAILGVVGIVAAALLPVLSAF